jgi:hypothetical protein
MVSQATLRPLQEVEGMPPLSMEWTLLAVEGRLTVPEDYFLGFILPKPAVE